jgi:outer membrane protein assembly factor BamB
VNSLDLANLLSKFGSTDPAANLDNEGTVNSLDLGILLANFGKIKPSNSPGPSPSTGPTNPPVTSTGEWTQFGHNAQHTNYTGQSVTTPWKFKWEWNGAGNDGKKQSSHLAVPDMIQPITGGNRVYMVANNTLFALDKTTGSTLWNKSGLGTITATPAYDNESIYLPTSTGLYKLNATNGTQSGSFTAAGSISNSVTIYNTKIYIVSDAGILYAVDKSTLAKSWEYATGSKGATPASFSPAKNLLILTSQDLNVHAVNATDGTRKWRVKPTSRTYQSGNLTAAGAQAEQGWPVIAEQHGIVFIRYRLDWDTLWAWNPYPTTNTQIRANLEGKPDQQALFALKLDTGAKVFTPAVGNGGAGDGGTLPMGPQPVIRNVDGKEVAYIIWRNALTCAGKFCDGREDATMGEMVLDNTSVSGYSAGDVRFVKWIDIQTDEMMYITMANDTLFNSHWLINSAEKITDRSASKGNSYINPISVVEAPFVIWRQVYCPPSNSQCNPQLFPGGSGTSYGPSNCPFDAKTRYCKDGLYAYGDQRSYPPGFYEYHNDRNDGSVPFTVVSNGLVLVKARDGGLLALESGNPLANATPVNQLAQIKSQDNILGAQTPLLIDYKDASKHISENVTATGVIKSVVNHRPKAIYLGFKDPHDGELLIRVFEKDLPKFNYDLNTLKDKKIKVTGFISLYWPDNIDPEIIVTDPSQIQIE